MSCNCNAKLQELSVKIINELNAMKFNKNSVIVFDIDDTLFSSKTREPIIPILKVYFHAVKIGLIPVIITARPLTELNVMATSAQLASSGIHTDYSYFIPIDENGKPVVDNWNFKYHCRKNIHDMGLNVVMSIGDMPWDIGAYGGLGILVPVCNC